MEISCLQIVKYILVSENYGTNGVPLYLVLTNEDKIYDIEFMEYPDGRFTASVDIHLGDVILNINNPPFEQDEIDDSYNDGNPWPKYYLGVKCNELWDYWRKLKINQNSNFNNCPYCGKEFDFPKQPIYCPYCKGKL